MALVLKRKTHVVEIEFRFAGHPFRPNDHRLSFDHMGFFMLTQSELKELVSYNPDTGQFFWRVQLSPRAKLGVPIGTESGTGHLTIRIHRKPYLLHRLAFLYVEGKFPESDIDHRNSIPSDNRWSNLRLCTKLQNRHNAGRSAKRNGLIGSKRSSQSVGKPFRAGITFNGISKHIGYFDTAEEAHHAYLIAKAVLHPFWDHSNRDIRSLHLDLTYPGNLSKKFQKFVSTTMGKLLEEACK